MTTAADDSAVEDAFEALLAGRPVPEGAAALAAFTGAVRASATTPGRPNAALAELLATGLLTDQSSPSVRTATSAGSAPERRRPRVRTRRRTAMIFSALLAKFLSAGAVAQAATGATVAVVAFTGVGAVGALPDPVQDTFAAVVAEVTPLEPPTSEETSEEVVPEETLAEEVETTEEVPAVTPDADVVDVQAWIEAGPAGYESFGEWVSLSAGNTGLREALRLEGKNFGSVISQWAHDKGYDEDDLAAEGVDLDALTGEDGTGEDGTGEDGTGEDGTDEDTTEQATDVVTDDEQTVRTQAGTTAGDRGSRGNGNGSGSGQATGGSRNGSNSGNGGGNGKD